MEENGRKKVQDWTCGDVRLWLQGKGFSNYSNIFSKDHKIDGKALLAMDESDLRNPPLELKILGDIKRLWLEIDAIQQRNRPTTASFHTPNGYLRRKSVYKIDGVANIGESPYDDIFVSDDDRLDWDIFSAFSNISETGRTLISVVYAFSVFFVTSFVMVFVHDRVPDMKKYPPLPDIVLDNVPLIPWAFEMCEVTALILSVVLAIVIFLHKHRIIVVRRLAALCGTVFLLRCVTMFVTSLSVPGIHLECSGKLYGDTWAKIQRAFVILFGFGLSVNGVRTCGDYMFSGHTVSITLLNFFISEYTPAHMYYLHTCCWVLNMFGIFFILAAHEHYSIDVVIAFYITSRLFLYYHTLANTLALKRIESRRSRVWFPLFWFFEEKVSGKVPNEYEWPLKKPDFLCSKQKST
ncbi:sphingomyelin synthase-related protein 1-like [Acropora millepora]|uniref:sphingomyelin synthase-related protein 1-like n=1 Tax=Acropora millepora TaxID=45264 RepID=UPI001CF21C23|nr:sphingomyelin synthase-related protein 1-like [Acropora millepora]